MLYEDLGQARAQYHAIRGLVIHYPGGGWLDGTALGKLDDACRVATAATHDAVCRRCISAIEEYARELYSPSRHPKWARGRTSGADYLRLLILRELDAYHARLAALELRDEL